MTPKIQFQNGISRIWLRAASAALASAALLVAVTLLFGALAPPSAQAQTFKVLHKFQGYPDGKFPSADLVAFGGKLYGTTLKGGGFCGNRGCGTVFQLDKTTGVEIVLYSFLRRLSRYGAGPSSGLVGNGAGKFYGTTGNGGGLGDGGVVYKIDTSGVENVLYRFGGIHSNEGFGPGGGLLRDAAGNLYGTAINGGDPSCDDGNGCGTVFKLDTARQITVLHTFTGGPDGSFPDTNLVRDPAGNLYGAAQLGGSPNATCAPEGGCGIVFKIDATGKESVLYSFTGAPDGDGPGGDLALDAAGNLYGTTGIGGANGCSRGYGCGTVFKVDTATGKETVLYSFAGGTDGANPNGVIRDAAGNLYGTTATGGNANAKCIPYGTCGTVFEMDTTGKESILHRFLGPDGEFPVAGLLRDKYGNLYGTTSAGTRGAKFGVVFEITP
jgi:uncharacterized repeat protein (TIGR03803 family)